jgi:hypothetical protein
VLLGSGRRGRVPTPTTAGQGQDRCLTPVAYGRATSTSAVTARSSSA